MRTYEQWLKDEGFPEKRDPLVRKVERIVRNRTISILFAESMLAGRSPLAYARLKRMDLKKLRDKALLERTKVRRQIADFTHTQRGLEQALAGLVNSAVARAVSAPRAGGKSFVPLLARANEVVKTEIRRLSLYESKLSELG